ncbi:DNA polymerase II large subunit [Methanopyrus sp. SNP6]|uniref:DNA polymerase II large subunit n=1 Tax=Methanopyrus sp. SNP6 TaxID=1937005 RepID=UPI0011E5BB84|nr:DNA polymerase II large subunit [Methanopyrus sp. SNP6]
MNRAREELDRYRETLEEVSSRFVEVATKARQRREDPKPEPEVMLATSIGERVEGLLQVENVADRLEELEEELGDREEATFRIVEEVIKGELKVKGDLPMHKRIDYAVRIGLAILTEAVVSAPLEGIAAVEIRERGTGHKVVDESEPPHEEPKLVCTECGKEVDSENCYLAVKYAGPIRAAGGTAAALSALLADYARQVAGLPRFDPDDFDHDLVGRYVEEVVTYLDKVGSFQYNPSEEEIELVAKNIPIEIDGEPTEEVEVQGHRDIPHLPNRLRGGALLVICEGICQKAPKLIKRVEKYGIDGWEFLEKLVNKGSDDEEEEGEEGETKVKPNDKYMGELVAGRPLLSHPSAKGGFRLRYGRARNTGFAAVGIHPSLMYVTKGFIVIGTQLKVERPGKAACVLPVTEIEPPVVRLRDGSVVRLDDPKKAKELVEKDEIEEILDLGEMLVAVGEFIENNHPLVPPAYCPEWWVKEVPDVIKVIGLKKNLPNDVFEKLKDVPLKRLVKEASRLSGNGNNLDNFLNGPVKVARSIIELVRKEVMPRLSSPERMSVEEAIELSLEYGVPFHPKYTFLWHDVEPEDVDELRETLEVAGSEWGNLRVEFENDGKVKRILEYLLVPHRIEDGTIVVEEPWASALLAQLGYDPESGEFRERNEDMDYLLDYLVIRDETCRYVSKLAGFPIREKAPTRIGARMGRPEKARERKMSPPPHVLFPIGIAGGNQRDIMKFHRGEWEDTDRVEVCYRICPECDRLVPYRVCPFCGTETVQYCNRCDEPADECDCEEPDPVVRADIEWNDDAYSSLPVRELVRRAEEEVGTTDTLKGVKGMTSRLKMPEPLQKGILRAKRDLFVFKDGTLRFDCNDCPLTHVRLKEVGLTPFKARLLGFERDINGDPVISENQVVELYPQDVVLPRKAAEWAVRVCQYLDDLLRKYYGLEPVYGVEKPEDLIGHLIVTLAPHTSCGVVGRVVGIADINCWYNHPIINAARRRNCDGDEDAFMLLLDVLLNFSRLYLPDKRGGLMDAPLVLTAVVDPYEIDDEVWNMDVCGDYPLELYRKALEYSDAGEAEELIERLEDRLDLPRGLQFTHDTEAIDLGPTVTRYSKLEKMEEKLEEQLDLAKRIRAVNESDVAKIVLDSHFLPDIKGNLRKFGRQKFRCSRCNAKFNVPPLSGKCPRCGSDILLTIYPATATKYLEPAKRLVEEFGTYDEEWKTIASEVELLEEEAKTLFGSDHDVSLKKFFGET